MIVLSDGEPAPSGKFSEGWDLVQEVRKAEAVAKVYGIGIASAAVSKFYKRYVILRDTTELGDQLCKIFKENIGGRNR